MACPPRNATNCAVDSRKAHIPDGSGPLSSRPCSVHPQLCCRTYLAILGHDPLPARDAATSQRPAAAAADENARGRSADHSQRQRRGAAVLHVDPTHMRAAAISFAAVQLCKLGPFGPCPPPESPTTPARPGLSGTELHSALLQQHPCVPGRDDCLNWPRHRDLVRLGRGGGAQREHGLPRFARGPS